MKVNAENAREFAAQAQALTLKNGVFTMNEIESRCKSVFSIVAQHKKWLEQRRHGVYKWVGPEDISILTGESIFRAYLKYNEEHTGGGKRQVAREAAKKANGKVPGIKTQIVNLTVLVNDLQKEVAALRAELG